MENPGGYSGTSGPHNAGGSNKKLQQTQAQVDEISATGKVTNSITTVTAFRGIGSVPKFDSEGVVAPNTLCEDLSVVSDNESGRNEKERMEDYSRWPPTISEVVGIMRTNVAKVLERDEKLSELDQRADNLQIGASQFEQQASRLKRKYWWKNLKMMIIIGVICAALLIIIFVSIFSGGSSDSSSVQDSNSGGTSGNGR